MAKQKRKHIATEPIYGHMTGKRIGTKYIYRDYPKEVITNDKK